MGGPIIKRRRWAVFAGALVLLTAAAPDGGQIVFDASILLADDGCLAPATGSCAFMRSSDGATSPSASAALIAPDRPVMPQSLLVADLSGLLDFGPQAFVRKASAPASPPKLIRRSAAPVICLPRSRHRPDRSVCGRAGAGRIR